MGVVHEGAPVFLVGGDAGAVDVAVSGLRTRGERFVAVAGALELVSTDAWSGRAADRFRDRFDVEPVRWRDAGEGFFTAASGLSGWAGALRSAGPRVVWCREEWARGEAESVRARAGYDADVRAGRAEKAGWEADNGPGTFSLTVYPFVDSGEPVREGARVEFASVVADLEAASEECARLVRVGCEAAPGKRNWLESGLAFVGGVFVGAGEALWDLGTMVYELGPVDDLIKLATGDLTPEELAVTYELKWETAQGLWDAASSDPWGFGLQVGKSVLDWDTWADDPARALGHLVPDAVAAVFTAGSSAAVTRGGSAMATLGMHADDLAEGAVDVARVVDRVEGVSDLRHLDELGDLGRLDELSDVGRLDELGDLGRLDDVTGLNRVDDAGPPGSMFQHDNALDGYRNIDDQLSSPSYSSSNRDIVDPDYEVLGRDPDGTPLTRRQFEDGYLRRTPEGDYPYDWNWPAHDGAVPGTGSVIDPSDVPRVDRIGGEGGSYFADDGTLMSQRSLPPDRLNFDRNSWDVVRDHPDLSDGTVRIERSDVAPHFGQDGGGAQYRFLDEHGNALSQAELKDRGLIAPVGGSG